MNIGTAVCVYVNVHVHSPTVNDTAHGALPPPRKVPTSLADIVAGRITVLFLQPFDRRSFGRSGSPLANPVVKHGEPVVGRQKVGINSDGSIHLSYRIAVALAPRRRRRAGSEVHTTP